MSNQANKAVHNSANQESRSANQRLLRKGLPNVCDNRKGHSSPYRKEALLELGFTSKPRLSGAASRAVRRRMLELEQRHLSEQQRALARQKKQNGPQYSGNGQQDAETGKRDRWRMYGSDQQNTETQQRFQKLALERRMIEEQEFLKQANLNSDAIIEVLYLVSPTSPNHQRSQSAIRAISRGWGDETGLQIIAEELAERRITEESVTNVVRSLRTWWG